MQLVAQLPWKHNITLMQKVKDKEIRRWYMQKCLEEVENYQKIVNREYILINLIYQKSLKSKEKSKIIEKIQMKGIKNIIVYNVELSILKNVWYDLDEKEKERYKYLYMLDLSREELKEFSKGDEVIMAYKKKLDKLNEKEYFHMFITPEEDELYCHNSDIEVAVEEAQEKGEKAGIIKGTKLGVKQEKMEIAKSMLKEGLSMDMISKITKIKPEELAKLKVA